MAATREEKLAKKRAYAKAHPQTAEYKRATYLRNREKALERAKRYAVERADEIAAYQKAYVAANKDAIKAYQKAYHRAASEPRRQLRREAYRRNPEAFSSRTRVRNSAAAVATVMWDEELDALVFSEAKRLRQMRDKCTGIKWHVDHIVPLLSSIVSGLHCFSNIAVIPAQLNLSKGNRRWPDMPE